MERKRMVINGWLHCNDLHLNTLTLRLSDFPSVGSSLEYP